MKNKQNSETISQASNGNEESATTSDEFPTPESLRQANSAYKQKKTGKDENGRVIPSPATRTKQHIFNISEYEAIDARACQAPADLHDKPLNDLVSYLIKPTKHELAKVRVVFRWIAAQNLAQLSNAAAGGSFPPQTPLDYLLGIKNNIISYHTLMEDMCRCAGIETAEVEGYMKHAGYQPEDDVGTSKFEGSWTAILINGTWHLANVRWCSKHVTGVDPGEWQILDDNGTGPRDINKVKREIRYKYDESFFLTNPEQFIYSHFPKEQKWQLLARPVSLEEFTQMAKLESHFFGYQLRLKSHRRCVESAPEGIIKIELEIPPNTDYEFMYRLWISKKGNEIVANYRDKELKQFVFLQGHDGTMSWTIEFPVTGKFKLELFCGDKAVSDTYFPICTYVINVQEAKKDAKAYPTDSRPQWGPSYDLKTVGLKPITHERGMVQLDKGEMEMSFSMNKDVSVLPKVHSNTKTADIMKGFVIYRVENNKLILNMKFPEAGDYALNLYAKEKVDDDSNGLPNVCSYLISTDQAAMDTSPFFISGNGQLGATDNFNTLRMKTISQPLAYIEDPNNGEMDFSFDTPVPCDLHPELILCRDNEEQNMEGYTFTVKKIDKATVKARFPEKGNYMLKIYGREKSEDGSFPLVFVYFIVVKQPMSDCCQFPKTYGHWTDGCELLEPTVGSPLYINKTIPFAVKVPEADEVVVVHPTAGMTHLRKDDKLTWRGDVNTGGEAGKDIQLCAGFNDDPTSYSVLLEFKVLKAASSQLEANQTQNKKKKHEQSKQDEDRKKQTDREKEEQQREQEESERRKEAEDERRKRQEEEEEEEERLQREKREQQKMQDAEKVGRQEGEQKQTRRQNESSEEEKRRKRKEAEEQLRKQKTENEERKREEREEQMRRKREEEERAKREREKADREERRRQKMEQREREEEWKKQFREQERKREMGEFEWRRQQAITRRQAIDNLFQ